MKDPNDYVNNLAKKHAEKYNLKTYMHRTGICD